MNITAGLIPAPAAVDYSVTMLTPVDEPILPMLNGSLDGTLAWDPAHGGGASIELPINWTAVRALPRGSDVMRAALPCWQVHDITASTNPRNLQSFPQPRWFPVSPPRLFVHLQS